MKHLLFSIIFFTCHFTFAQQSFEYTNPKAYIGEELLSMGFAGGINAAQIHTADLNGDGVEEWVIWDINARSLKVIEVSEDGYEVLPEMPHYFPADLLGFVVMADYDGDGKKDLFTGSAFGIKAYKNTSPTGSATPSWELAENFLRLENGSNLQVNILDIPAIQDLDGDGDLDIVTFNYAAGDYLELYINTSLEETGMAGLGGFERRKIRWGNFEFCACGSFSFGQTCDGSPISRKTPGDENLSIEHSGGHSILLEDFNGDGNLDLVMGQDECSTLYYLENKGSSIDPIYDEFSTELPGYGSLPIFPLFQVGSIIGDSFLVSVNSSETSLTGGLDYAHSIYELAPQTSPNIVTTALLQEEMIDLGENTRPFFTGSQSNGELILTANQLLNGQSTGMAFRFEVNNEGYRLVESDYQNLSSLGLTELQYIAYTTAAGQNYWFVSGVVIEDFVLVRKLFYANSPGAGELREISLPTGSLRAYDNFSFYSHAGADFLLLARQTGELERYSVKFSGNVAFELLDEDFLGFKDDPADRNLCVLTTQNGEQLDLYAVSQRGIISHIPNFTQANPPAAEPIQIVLEDNTAVPSRLSRNTWLGIAPGLIGKGDQLLLGGNAGGLQLLQEISSSPTPPVDGGISVTLFPNPSNGPVNILSNENGKARLINTLGQLLISDISIIANEPQPLDMRNFSSGVYLIEFTSSKGNKMVKKLILR